MGGEMRQEEDGRCEARGQWERRTMRGDTGDGWTRRRGRRRRIGANECKGTNVWGARGRCMRERGAMGRVDDKGRGGWRRQYDWGRRGRLDDMGRGGEDLMDLWADSAWEVIRTSVNGNEIPDLQYCLVYTIKNNCCMQVCIIQHIQQVQNRMW